MVDRDREAAALERELGVWQERRQRQMRALWEQRKTKGRMAVVASVTKTPEAKKKQKAAAAAAATGDKTKRQDSAANHARATMTAPRFALAADCAACHARFGLTKRRHHCRACGGSFCSAHASGKALLPALGFGAKPVRVCDDCSADARISANLAAHDADAAAATVEQQQQEQQLQQFRATKTAAVLLAAPVLPTLGALSADSTTPLPHNLRTFSPTLSPTPAAAPSSPMLFAMSPVS